MSMTSAMEWEAPIPAWIESIDIDIDELPVSDLMVLIPGDMDNTPQPSTPKGHSFLTCSTELHSPMGAFNDDVAMLETESAIEMKSSTAPNLSPIIKSKVTAKPGRRSGRKASVDPSGRDQRRKDKQRGYETNYRKRQKEKRERDQIEWVQLETQLREMLVKRTTYIVVGSGSDDPEMRISTISMRQRYLELLQEERALRESEALDNCVWAETQAMTFWGGANSKTRDIREQMNTLPSLRGCHTFTFSW
ncbi:hypothetical protein KXD40_007579 [Peronospora effusa]|uniref:BZIP domain-containing protein n=1 Tax=Peronospora effusa TaxID=542832 RepID=A0A3M6VP17_9STRA|nr:hypothetical protein DD238_002149 [Peronospora effusa]UIZ28888.1 hypothetical protein KXD40_007579 [Peronospora effusa]CAI5704131.1 unnamed protein product [Peronospora effusa]